MAKTFMERIKEIQDDASGASILKIQREAIEIILDAVGTEKWENFIRNFVDNEDPHQLARLRLQDAQGTDPYVRQSVAYLLSNPTCGMDTPQRLSEFVDILDKNMPSDESSPAGGEEPKANR